MKKIILSILINVLCISFAFAEEKSILVSSTTSTENSGLLGYILPLFKEDTGISVKVMAKGTGAAIKDGEMGNVDAILVHDTVRELAFIEKGYGTKRYYVMYNDFVIIGDAQDKANIKEAKTSQEAFQAIADAKSPFISRGDESGTHSQEARIWAKTSVTLEKDFPSDRSWYFSIGQGMSKTIIMADEKQAYALSDRGTFYSMKYAEPKANTELEILFEGDESLLNLYGYIPVNPEKFPYVKYEYANLLGEWLVSDRGKKAIADFKAQGRQLFFIPE